MVRLPWGCDTWASRRSVLGSGVWDPAPGLSQTRGQSAVSAGQFSHLQAELLNPCTGAATCAVRNSGDTEFGGSSWGLSLAQRGDGESVISNGEVSEAVTMVTAAIEHVHVTQAQLSAQMHSSQPFPGALCGSHFTDEETEIQRGPERAQHHTPGERCIRSFTLGGGKGHRVGEGR